MSTSIIKPCEGAVQKLAPMRMIDAIQQSAAAAPTVNKSANAYVPPSKRSAADTAAAEALVKAKGLSEADMNSATLFPTLGAAPVAPKGVWGKKLAAPLNAAPAPTSAPLNTQNAFAALSDDAQDAVSVTSSAAPLNFKAMIEERVEKDREEAALAAIPETEDPNEMTEAQLIRAGWSVLHKPFKSQADPLLGLAALQDFVARQDWRETPTDPFEAYVQNGETWDGRLGIPEELLERADPYQLMLHIIGEKSAGPDPYAVKASKEESTTSTGMVPKSIQRLQAIYKQKCARQAAATVAATS